MDSIFIAFPVTFIDKWRSVFNITIQQAMTPLALAVLSVNTKVHAAPQEGANKKRSLDLTSRYTSLYTRNRPTNSTASKTHHNWREHLHIAWNCFRWIKRTAKTSHTVCLVALCSMKKNIFLLLLWSKYKQTAGLEMLWMLFATQAGRLTTVSFSEEVTTPPARCHISL